MTAAFPRPPRRGGRSDTVDDARAFVPLARLASLSETLAAQPLGPSPAFREELRARLLAEAGSPTAGGTTEITDTSDTADISDTSDTAPVVPLFAPSHRHPVLKGAAAGVALVLAGGGVAAAAAGDALPGDTLHPLKRFTESVRDAADLNRNEPSHVLREIDVRLSELERSSRLGAGTAATGVPTSRWPAMVTALSEVDGELGRLAPRDSDPTVREALLQRRQRLSAVLPTLTTRQQPAVQQLITRIDALTGQPGGGLSSSAPGLPAGDPPTVPGVALAVPGGVADVLVALRGNLTAATDETTPAASPRPTTHDRRVTASGTRSTHPRAATTRTNRTTSASGTGTARVRRTDSATPSSSAPLMRTVTVTVTTVTTRTTGGSASNVVGPTVTTAERVVTTTTGAATSAISRTVSTTTRTVTTRAAVAPVLPTTRLTDALGGS
jgi:hypothetical protein